MPATSKWEHSQVISLGRCLLKFRLVGAPLQLGSQKRDTVPAQGTMKLKKILDLTKSIRWCNMLSHYRNWVWTLLEFRWWNLPQISLPASCDSNSKIKLKLILIALKRQVQGSTTLTKLLTKFILSNGGFQKKNWQILKSMHLASLHTITSMAIRTRMDTWSSRNPMRSSSLVKLMTRLVQASIIFQSKRELQARQLSGRSLQNNQKKFKSSSRWKKEPSLALALI